MVIESPAFAPAPAPAPAPALVALPPPPPPSDLIASALFIPLHKISTEHRGRKLRFLGQILAFHTQTSLLLLTSYPAIPNSHTPSPTILVDISTPLLGETVRYDQTPLQRPPMLDSPATATATAAVGAERMYGNRENITLARGEWVCVVGWLEGDGERMVRKVKVSSSFVKPLPLILEAIHISNARPPPVSLSTSVSAPS
ncbi:hypothetical protein I316_06129 [Kwoniella heveanensis BCC8398]|uniref:Uncharacterized protein n=1 Tax=Kwoniella heveanensis BCC8398 TaxID=1296120 RepID=A0A1B9GMX5_9TREE|nr:hypothetical protein I316_06129 [Kwoniella heveanensis BCC8398]